MRKTSVTIQIAMIGLYFIKILFMSPVYCTSRRRTHFHDFTSDEIVLLGGPEQFSHEQPTYMNIHTYMYIYKIGKGRGKQQLRSIQHNSAVSSSSQRVI